MKGKVSTALAIFLLVVATTLTVIYQRLMSEPAVTKNVVVEIEKGDSFGKITQKLIKGGVNLQPMVFKVIAYRKSVLNRLKAGEYELTSGLTLPQILDLFAEGKARTYTITFPEGWGFKEILGELQNNPNLEQTLINKSATDIAAKLGLTEQNPEGWVFPDTYVFEKKATDLSVLKMAHEKMQSVLQTEWQGKAANLPYKSPYEALIMASIVEKESGSKSERDKIAGVFVRRLQKGMLLQTDPTVIYGMGDTYKGNIRAADLTTKTAYNTYVINGLPPTPIAMPGEDAIHATLHPDSGDSLYFVAKGDGSHHFSATLTEHNQAVDQFQKHLKH